jgi:hypothetical protein
MLISSEHGMSDFLVAYFHTQSEAVESAEKLLACGILRKHVTLHVANRPEADNDDGSPQIPDPGPDGPPGATLWSEGITLSVILKDPVTITEVCSVLEETGAYLIDVTEQNVTQEYPDM